MLSSPRIVLSGLIVVTVSFLLTACSGNPTRALEQPITVQASTSKAPEMPGPAPIARPTREEIQETVGRLFKGDLALLGGRQPLVLIGDFNGDTYPDLVVAVKPTPAKLDEINSVLANWSVQNPHHSYVPPKDKSVVVLPPVPKPERVKVGEELLLVIHGYGAEGWRDPLATQTYLLKQSVGLRPKVEKPSDALAKDFGPFPSPRDIISEDFAGQHGAIYWTGAAYAWHAEK